jgi:subtilase family serine protease
LLGRPIDILDDLPLSFHPSVSGESASELSTPMTPKKLHTIQFTVLFALLSVSALQASAQSTFVQPRITQAVDETKLTVLKHNTYPLARAEFDRGPAPASLPMESMLLVLRRSPEQEAALDKLMAEQLDKSSPNFHEWLAPAEFGRQFGPSDQDVQTVTSWLGSHGFQVIEVSNGRTVISFSGNAGQVQQAFHTAIHSYVVKGEQHWANSSDPQIPTALAPVIAGINTLHNFPKHAAYARAGEFIKSKETGKVTAVNPQFTFPNAANCGTNCFAVGPTDFATIYNVLPLWTGTGTPGGKKIDGTGVTIAVVGQSDINPQDNVDFRSIFGLPAGTLNILPTTFPAGVCSSDPGLNGPNTQSDFEAEAAIDTQWSGGVAKGATIDFVRCASTNTANGVDLAATYIINTLDVAPTNIAVLSDSFGNCELDLGSAGNLFYFQMWQQAASQGISVFVASGDSGSAGCDIDADAPPSSPSQFGLAVSGTSSTPFNVAVGGTDFNDFTNPAQFWSTTPNPTTNSTGVSALSYIPELVWNNSCASVEFASLGFSADPVANCNNSQLTGTGGANSQDTVETVGGGGGASNCTSSDSVDAAGCFGGFAKPFWQAGLGVPNDGVRDVPDVSLFAGNGFNSNFYIVCQQDDNKGGNLKSCDLSSPFLDFQGFGGTSVSAQAMAGIMALVVQETGENQGNPNPVHYNLATQANIFHAITGNNAMPCTPGIPDCTNAASGDKFGVLTVQTGPLAGSIGYNNTGGFSLASGLGSMDAFNFVTNKAWTTALPADFSLSLPNPPAPPTPTTLTLTPGGSQTTTLTITGSGGYNGTINFTAASCSGLPAGNSCSFNPPSVGPGNGTTTLTVKNTGSGMLVPASHQNTSGSQAGASRLILLFSCFAILWLGIQAGRRKLRWSVVASLLVVGCLVGIAACGGGSSMVTPPPPPPNASNQTVVITATDGTNTHSIYFLLTVQ